ncbi:FecCD family ABC transporter permease [Zhihengliuella flava]|uniref:Iron complex transport system permease protein n=1 Tax=Zhihengliuella flava TaxID=1285193 RepID=A0A931GFJ1_9MICC|nr:iron chelate uptake ABC transporter family permease subunit [Zhihengliuella flava]MBG6085295.1 iron complex transport system permease protein [Zhihengliuella flava]
MSRVSFVADRWHVRLGAASLIWSRRTAAITAIMVAAAVVIGLVSLALGDYTLTLPQVIAALGDADAGLARTVVVEWRLPRAVAAAVFGAALAVSGAIFQTMTRNPLASPDIIGLSHGSMTGMLIALVFFGGHWAVHMTGALAGGIGAAIVIYLLSYRAGLQGFRFIIVGIGISAMLAAANTWFLLEADLETAMTASAWGAGTLNRIQPDVLAPVLIVIAVLLVALLAAVPVLRQMDLGDDVAAVTGVRLNRARLLLIVAAVALVAAVTVVAGPISFVALAAPQIARRLCASPTISLTAAGAVGALMLLVSDVIAQHVVPLTIPVGVVTVVIGGAYLIWLLSREVRRNLS